MKLKLSVFLICFAAIYADDKIDKYEKNIFRQVNEHRQTNNKNILKYDPLISRVCRKHAEAMANKTATFSHDGFDMRFEEIHKLVPKVSAAAENIAWNQGFKNPDSTAVLGWIESPPHHKAMLGDYMLTGIGGARSKDNRFYFNQIFVKCRKTKY
jgi:uncharacterized protein YkwD